MTKNIIRLLGPSLENSRRANTKSVSGNVILQKHMKCTMVEVLFTLRYLSYKESL